MDFEQESLVLPTAYSLGRLTVYPPGEGESPQLMEARGTVHVPAGANLFLSVSQELCDDLSKIHLVPERLLANGITFSEKNLDKTDFEELLSLAPCCVVIHSCNAVSTEQIHDIGELRTIEHLNFSNTPLQLLDFSWVPQLSNLRTLTLSGIGVDDAGLGFITKLQHLEDLYLRGAKVSDPRVRGLWEMETLKDVKLGQCPIGDEALGNVGSCLSLRSLKVPETRISDRGVEVVVNESLRTGQRLTGLSLRSCRITDMSLVRLASLKDLVLLDLYSIEVTPEGAAFLKRSLPECRIFMGRDKGGGPNLSQVTRRDRPA